MTDITPVSATDAQIRQLAAQINRPQLNFTPGEMRKGTITAVDLGDPSTPPTVTVLLSGDTTTPIAGVYLAANYSPQIGDMCLLFKQGNEFFAQGTIASSSAGTGWTTPALSSGNTHNGNSNGKLMYRRVLDNGAWKMQWQGGINYGGPTSILAAALDATFSPSVKRSMITAREVQSGSISVGVDFTTTGTVVIVGENQGPLSTGGQSTSSAAPGGSTGFDGDLGGGTGGASAGTAHTHGVSTGGHSHGISVDSHWHGNGTHSHPVNSPSWIAINLEYFL